MDKIERKYITIIDGYNVINAWDELKRYVNFDLEHARDILIEKLVNYKFMSNERIILVFDANYVKDNKGSKDIIKGIEIVYTRETINADSYIEEMVARLANDRRNVIKVVTYDYAEQQNILGSGASRVTPEEFKYKIIDTEKRLKLIYVEEEKRKTNKSSIEDMVDDEMFKKLKKIIP
jgi:predicted RNA-binding protein with PIN domain